MSQELIPLQPDMAGDAGGSTDVRRRVQWLILVRLVGTFLLLLVTIGLHLKEHQAIFGEAIVPLYVLIGAIFLLTVIYSLAVSMVPNLWLFCYFQIIVDVVYFTVLVYFTGGTSSAFTMIYVFPIISSGILLYRRDALLVASAAGVLFGLLVVLQFYRFLPQTDWPWTSPLATEAPGYALWVTVVHLILFFLTAVASAYVAEQLRRTKASLTLKEMDYRELSELHAGIVRSISSGILTTDEHDRVTFVNRAGMQLLGSESRRLTGMPLSALFPEIQDAVDITSERRQGFSTTRRGENESSFFELTVTDLKSQDGVPRGRLVVFQDVSDIKRMEERVKQSERQAAFVRIAARMAHEIRNPLAALRGAAELLTYSASGEDSDKRLSRIIIREADRLNSLLGDFLLTVSPPKHKSVRLLLNDLVKETVDLFIQGQGRDDNILIETTLAKGVEIEGDPSTLKQAIWNLLVNAKEAISGDGKIRIVLSSDKQKRLARLEIQDSGSGITTEIRDKIFEHFTTTKERGSGLGLPIVHTIIQAHDGAIDFETHSVNGTKFIVTLPIADEAAVIHEGSGDNV